MEIFVWAFLASIVGAVLMDIAKTYASEVGMVYVRHRLPSQRALW